jgi:hypothetical protein
MILQNLARIGWTRLALGSWWPVSHRLDTSAGATTGQPSCQTPMIRRSRAVGLDLGAGEKRQVGPLTLADLTATVGQPEQPRRLQRGSTERASGTEPGVREAVQLTKHLVVRRQQDPSLGHRGVLSAHRSKEA